MDREMLADKLLTILPSMLKRLVKGFIHGTPATKQQFELLHRIQMNNGKPMTFYSEEMMISKPNLTVVADKLIDDGLLVREYDPADRRVIILRITQKGDDFLEEHKVMIKKAIGKRLEDFSDKDVERIGELLSELKEIFDRVDNRSEKTK